MYENDLVRASNWTGIVEDIDDPLMNNRLRIRINGFHNANKTILPTDCLPWAMVGLPVNGSGNFSVPKIGDWVIGFFLDGESAQFPVVTHVLPGINTVVVKQPVGYPTMPAGELYQVPGQPSNPPLSRQVVQYTAIDKSNRSLVHVCDIGLDVDQAVGGIKTFFNVVGKEIRAAINLVIEALNFDATGQLKIVAEYARKIVRFIKEVNRVLKSINDAINYFIGIVQRARALIDYILNLPAKYAALFKDCLRKLYKIIMAGVKSLFPDLGGNEDLNDLTDAFNEANKAFNETITLTAKIAATPAKLGAALLTPTSAADGAAAAASVKQLIADTPATPSPIDAGAGP